MPPASARPPSLVLPEEKAAIRGREESMADNASTVRAIYQAFNDKDIDRLVSLCAPQAKVNNVPFGMTMSVRDYAQNYANGFPDSILKIERLISADQQVVAEYTVAGTNTGTYETPEGTVSPTGRPIEAKMLEIFDFDDSGKVVAVTAYFDRLGTTRQLGLLQPMGVPGRPDEARQEMRH